MHELSSFRLLKRPGDRNSEQNLHGGGRETNTKDQQREWKKRQMEARRGKPVIATHTCDRLAPEVEIRGNLETIPQRRSRGSTSDVGDKFDTPHNDRRSSTTGTDRSSTTGTTLDVCSQFRPPFSISII